MSYFTPDLGQFGAPPPHAALDVDGALDGVDDDQYAVAGGLDDTPAMLRDAGVNYFFAKYVEARNVPFLVHANEPAISDNICGEVGGNPMFDALLCHGVISFRDTRNGSLYGCCQQVSMGAEQQCPVRVVERTFAWLCRNRRFAKDFETRVDNAAAYLQLAMIKLLIQRLATV